MSDLDNDLVKLVRGRRARHRVAGDGGGIDIGIQPGAYYLTIEKHIDTLAPETKARLVAHVRHHVTEALKPLVKLMERAGESDDQIKLFMDVGPNSLRTVIEHLEAEVND